MDGTASPGRVTRGAGFSALTALALAGCASLPPPTPARVAKAPTAYETAKAFAAPVADWPADGWWKRYGDPQLDALMDEAVAGSPTLAQAQARVVTARAATAVAAAQELPQLTAQGQAQEQKQTYAYLFPKQFLPLGYQDYGQVTLNLNWELDFWGKNRAAVRAAASDARAAAADAAEARLVLTTDIASQYATLARLYADRDVALQAQRVREETAGLAAQRVANGLDTQAELKQAQAGSPAARANVAALDEQIAQTRDALAALVGAGPDRGLALAPPMAAHLRAFGLPADLRVGLIGRRPDVIAARWRAEAASHRIKQAKAAFYPDINLAAYFGQQSLHLEQLFTPGAAMGSIGPAVTLPIFEGGRLRGALRGAQADRDAAVAAYDQAVTEALREVADVAASERALDQRLAESRKALDFYEGAYKVARLRYEGGLSTFQSVLLAEDAVLAQRQVVSDLESRAFTLDVALVRALGGGFTGAA
ncbi:MAG: efflux system, outer rane lipoprotein NodT family [Caulobacteraceae bacterium]|nr:efflux system, outer rane lipoprotein NodT family [Caulobacteraceae bacterium]